MSLIGKKYNNSCGTISKTFKIGKKRVMIDAETDGSLIFSVYNSEGSVTQ
jgi:hypothetical protein